MPEKAISQIKGTVSWGRHSACFPDQLKALTVQVGSWQQCSGSCLFWLPGHLPFTSRNSASGVALSDGIIKAFSDMQLGKSWLPEEVKKHEKMGLFCLSEDKKILWEEA